MKHSKFMTYLLFTLAVAGVSGCEDSRNEYLEDYQTLVYFRNGGEQDITLYRVGEDSFYEIPVCKGGRDIGSTAAAMVVSMSQTQLDIYNMDNNTAYTQLPSEYWSFVQTDDESRELEEPVYLEFAPEDRYQVIKVRIRTNELSELEEANPDKEYVLGLQVYADPKVSPDINIILLRPTIDIPMLSLSESGLQSYSYTSESPVVNTYTNEVLLGFDNRWDFTASVVTEDDSWVENYNAENETEYVLLPESAYTITPYDVPFTAGTNSGSFSVSVDRSEMSLLTGYLLPVRLDDCTKEEFEVDQNANMWLLNFMLNPDEIPLTLEMLSSPYTVNGDGDGLSALVGDPANNWWHSNYGGGNTGDPVYGHYIDIALTSPLTDVVFEYQTRTTNSNGVPTLIRIGVSNDGTQWTQIGECYTGLVASAPLGQWYTLPPYKSETSFTYVRFGIAQSALGDLTQVDAGTALSGLRLYGANLE